MQCNNIFNDFDKTNLVQMKSAIIKAKHRSLKIKEYKDGKAKTKLRSNSTIIMAQQVNITLTNSSHQPFYNLTYS